MQTVNKAILMGYVGNRPKVINLNNGEKKTIVNLATNSGYGDTKKTHWHTLIFFGKSAHTVSKLDKGDKLHVIGRIENRKWTDNENKDNWVTEIIVSEFSIIEGEVAISSTSDSNNNENSFTENVPPSPY